MQKQGIQRLSEAAGQPVPLRLPRPRIRRWALLREIVSTVVFLAAVYALVELATPRFYVEGKSMQPNFAEGQRLIVSRLNYLFGSPQRGEIVVFNAPGQEGKPPLIKRVIGLPGDLVEIRDAQVYINSVALDEPYINEPCTEFNCKSNTWKLGADEYFVMGDNRNHSNDSRSFGPVQRGALIGEALIRYWPPSDWGIVNHVGFPSG
jgi:signal peptidase I